MSSETVNDISPMNVSKYFLDSSLRIYKLDSAQLESKKIQSATTQQSLNFTQKKNRTYTYTHHDALENDNIHSNNNQFGASSFNSF